MPKLPAALRSNSTTPACILASKSPPSLRLAGDWLLHAGFRPGDVATVEVEEGQLISTRA